MPAMGDLREALAANLATIPDLAESAYVLGNPTAPCAEVMPGPVTYDRTMQRGTDMLRFTIRVYVGASLDVAAQKRLDPMLNSSGPYSVKEAVEQDRTLGGLADHTRVTESTGYRIYAREGTPALLGAEWTVEVLARGDT